MIALLLTSALYSVDTSAFVYRACFRDTDYDVELRPAAAKGAADMCVFQQTCGAAEVVVRMNPDAGRTFYVSSSSEVCR